METLHESARQAFALLLTGDPGVWEIIGVSFSVSLRAVLIITPFALVLAFVLAYARFPGKRPLVSALHSLQAVPAVVIGLLGYMLLSRSGPLGDLRLLFTQAAMVAAQAVLALPLMLAWAHAALAGADRRAWETARTLGASPWRAMLTVMNQVRFALLAAVVAGFARVIGEVGTALLVGGNIENLTRNITTAIALETSKGEFAQGIALGLVLLVLALGLNFFIGLLQGRSEMA